MYEISDTDEITEVDDVSLVPVAQHVDTASTDEEYDDGGDYDDEDEQGDRNCNQGIRLDGVNYSDIIMISNPIGQQRPKSKLQCEICGKPFKASSSQDYMLEHKLSHRSESEMKPALAGNEQGSTQLNVTESPIKQSTLVATTTRQNRKGGKGFQINMNGMIHKNNGVNKPFKCQKCRCVFNRNCNLVEHMKIHKSSDTVQDHSPTSRLSIGSTSPRFQVQGGEGSVVRVTREVIEMIRNKKPRPLI